MKLWGLAIVTSTDQTYRMRLLRSLHASLATLYPEIGSGESRRLPAKLGYALYGILAVLVIGVVIMMWVLASRGLISW